MLVTIVGHGPSIENAGLGKLIDDKSDYVVRLSRSYKSHNSIDHGSKFDYICTAPRSIKQLYYEPKLPTYGTWIYCPQRIVDSNSIYINKLKSRGFKPIVCVNEIKPWLIKYRKLNNEWKKQYLEAGDRGTYKYFSTGTAAIIIALQRIKNVDSLLLVGFDNVTKGSREGFVSLSKKCDPGVSGHNYAVEKTLLDDIISDTGVNLIVK